MTFSVIVFFLKIRQELCHSFREERKYNPKVQALTQTCPRRNEEKAPKTGDNTTK
jgi:hypothetical protein